MKFYQPADNIGYKFKILYYSVIGHLVESGYSDVSFLVEEEVVKGVKNVISMNNKTLKKIIEDSKAGSEIEISNLVTADAFKALLAYYGRGVIDLEEHTICDLMILCFCYNDTHLYKICKDYILSHMTIEIANHFLNMLPELEETSMSDIMNVTNDFILYNGWILLEENKILSNSVDALIYILKIPNLIVSDEHHVLKNLLHYYYTVKSKERALMKSDFQDNFKDVFGFVNWKELNVDDLNLIRKSFIINDTKLLNYCSRSPEIKRLYFTPTKNQHLNKYLANIIFEDVFIQEIDQATTHFLYLNDFDELIPTLLENNNPLIIAITLVLMMRLKIQYKEKDTKKIYDLVKKLAQSHEKTESVNMKQMIAKALTIFFNENICSDNYRIDEYLHDIYYNSNCELIARIYTFYDEFLNISNVRSRITSYISTLPFVYEDFALIKEIKGDNHNLNNILSTLPSFSYNSNSLDIIYYFGIKVNIPSNQTPRGCKYSIEPNLPKGLSIDKYTGVISGEPQVLINKTEYEVTCENALGTQTTKISLTIRTIFFQPEYCSKMIRISKDGYTITKTNDDTTVSHCYLKTVMNSGEEYHFRFKINQFDSNGEIKIGGTRTENYEGDNLYNQSNTHTIGFKTNSISRYGPGSNNNYTTSLVAGDVLEVIFNLKNCYIHYNINGKQCNNIFTSVQYPLYPFVELTSKGDSVTLLSVVKC